MKKLFLVPVLLLLLISSCKKDDPAPAFVALKLTIVSGTITLFPSTQADGTGWDNLSAPDIYFILFDGTNTLQQSGVSDDVPPGTQLNFGSQGSITNFSMVHSFILADKDSPDDDDAMALIEFRVNDFKPAAGTDKAKYPLNVNLTSTDGKFKVTLSILWS